MEEVFLGALFAALFVFLGYCGKTKKSIEKGFCFKGGRFSNCLKGQCSQREFKYLQILSRMTKAQEGYYTVGYAHIRDVWRSGKYYCITYKFYTDIHKQESKFGLIRIKIKKGTMRIKREIKRRLKTANQQSGYFPRSFRDLVKENSAFHYQRVEYAEKLKKDLEKKYKEGRSLKEVGDN